MAQDQADTGPARAKPSQGQESHKDMRPHIYSMLAPVLGQS